LALGRRGPTVHIGAALAAQLSNWVPTSPQHRRQMIAAGAAAGLAAGFNTPIAGVLFVVEELSRDMSGVTLEIAILASFTGSIISRLLGSADFNLTQDLLEDAIANGFSPREIPFYILLGILAGIVGTAFNQGVLASLRFNRRLQLPLSWRIGAAGAISGAIVALAPPMLQNNAGLREFFLSGTVDWRQTAIAFVLYFALTLLAYGSGAPGGLFSPALILGAALGYLVGHAEEWMLDTGSASTYALVGMAAFFTAVARVPITAIVIIFEMTTALNLVLPLMIGAAMAYGVASTLSPGSLYQRLLEFSGIELQEEAGGNDLLSGLKAADVMQRQVETLPVEMSLDEAVRVLSDAHHDSFPAMDDGRLAGIVTVAEVNLAKRRGIDGQTALADIMTPRPVTVRAEAPLSDVLYLMERYHLSHLPVMDGKKLVGIITRSDIIRAEANKLSTSIRHGDAKPDPSYLVYQTRAPAVGRGRLLLPLSNPETAPALTRLAIAIARARQYELECLHIILVPKHSPPAQTFVKLEDSHQLLERAGKLAEEWEIPIHTQVRVAQSTSQTILETIKERHIDLLLMGWKGSTSTPGRIMGNTVDILIQQVPCDVVLVKLGRQPNAFPKNQLLPTTWLVPMAGGPNAQRAIQLLPAFKLLTRSPRIWLCKVYSPDSSAPDVSDLSAAARSLEMVLDTPVTAVPIRSQSVAEATIRLATAQQCDVVMLGASREGLLQQAVRGNIPEAIALGVDCTTILVRGALE